MSNLHLNRFSLAIALMTLVPAAAGTAHAATAVVTNSSATWLANVAGVSTEAFENAAFPNTNQYGIPPGLNRAGINYSIDGVIDTGGRVVEMHPGAYAPTGVLSRHDTPNGQFSTVQISLSVPTDAFAIRHASWRGSQLQFTLTFTDLTTTSFFANTVGVDGNTVSGATPMAYTGVTANMPISRIVLQTTVAANDAFSRGINIDDFSLATAIPEPSSGWIALVALLSGSLSWRHRRATCAASGAD